MHETRQDGGTKLDGAWRTLTAAGLVLGPVLAVLSTIMGLATGPQPDSLRQSFDAMAEHGSAILAQNLLEAAGFAIVLTCFASAAREVRSRGGVLAVGGAVLALAGVLGFCLSDAAGLAVVALAQLPDRDTAFTAAQAISADGPIATLGALGFALEIAGQLGMLLILVGLWRARMVPIWAGAIAVLGIAVNAVFGSLPATVAADVLLLAVGAWVAVRLLRTTRSPATGDR